MPEEFKDKVNRILRDHEGYTGDGRGGDGDLPIGDRSTAKKPISKRDLRESIKAFGDIDGNATEALLARDQAVSAAATAAADAEAAANAQIAPHVAAAEAAEVGAQTAQGLAEGARDAAESARDAATVNAEVYADTAAGLAATVEGDQFQVVSGDEIIRYRHDAGPVATEVARYPASEGVAPVYDTYAQAVALPPSQPRVTYILEDETQSGKTTCNFFDGNVHRFDHIVAPFDVARLFYAGAKGAIWDFTDPSLLLDAVTGGSAVTAEGDLVVRVVDRSGNGNDLVRSEVGQEPLYRTRGGKGIRVGGTSNPGVLKSESVFDMDGETKVTVIIAHGVRKKEGTQIILEYGPNVSSTNGTFSLTVGNQTFLRGTNFGSRTIQPPYRVYEPEYVQVVSAVLDVQGADAAARFKTYRIGNVEIPLGSESGAFANDGPIPFSNQNLNLGCREGGLFPLMGDYYRCLVIAGELSSADLAGAYAWAKAGAPTVPSANVAFIGDSNTVMYLSQLDTPYFIPEVSSHLLAVGGNSIAQQQVRWNIPAVDHASFDAVVVRVGLNDLSDGGETAATVIARLQALIYDINADTSAPIVISQLTPCRTARPDYAKWQEINEAIAGNGATPITGVDARVTSHVALMDDGSGYLLPAYDTGDGIHLNNAGREIVANAEKAALVSLSVI